MVCACTMLEYLVHAPIRASASAQVPTNVQEVMTSVVLLSLIFYSVFLCVFL
ncbi:hypothetical protein [Bartonella krasnovii]|uniref:hypothetical protein n=1 Tax=Bartonella krasnovii TaxID=2267275 RepID=UPI003B986540